jgi:hypothetical protein
MNQIPRHVLTYIYAIRNVRACSRSDLNPTQPCGLCLVPRGRSDRFASTERCCLPPIRTSQTGQPVDRTCIETGQPSAAVVEANQLDYPSIVHVLNWAILYTAFVRGVRLEAAVRLPEEPAAVPLQPAHLGKKSYTTQSRTT